MCDYWHDFPPVHLQLRRIAGALGIKPATPGSRQSVQTSAPSTFEDAAAQAATAGMPVFSGRPGDPMLDLIPPPPGASP